MFKMRKRWILLFPLLMACVLLSYAQTRQRRDARAEREAVRENVRERREDVRDERDEERRQRFRARRLKMLQQRLSPEGEITKERLPLYIERFKNYIIYDSRSNLFEVKATVKEDGKVILTGECLAREQSQGIESMLGLLGFSELENRIQVLPESQLLPRAFALVTTHSLTLRRYPRERIDALDEVLLGEWVRLLKPSEQGDFFLGQIPNGYVGWIKNHYIQRVTQEELSRWVTQYPKFQVVQETMRGLRLIPTDARLPVVLSKSSATTVCVQMPGGGEIELPRRCGVEFQPGPDQSRAKILELAKPFLGQKYEWGGRTRQGVDCSGFTSLLFAMRGINLPRDADQMSNVGQIAGWRGFQEALLPGDLLFFLSQRTGRISHVAVSLGGDEIIQSSRGGVNIASLNREAENYDEREHSRFVLARRILKEGF